MVLPHTNTQARRQRSRTERTFDALVYEGDMWKFYGLASTTPVAEDWLCQRREGFAICLELLWLEGMNHGNGHKIT